MTFENISGRTEFEAALQRLWNTVVRNTNPSIEPFQLLFNWTDLFVQMNTARKSDAYQRYYQWVDAHREDDEDSEDSYQPPAPIWWVNLTIFTTIMLTCSSSGLNQ
jgi:hypothetical protein